MSKKEITSTEEEVQASEEAPAATPEANQAEEAVVEEAGPSQAETAEGTTQEASTEEAQAEKTAVAEPVVEEAAEAGADETVSAAETDDAGETAEAGEPAETGETGDAADADAKPRTRTRNRRTRSRRKPKDGDKNDDSATEKSGSREGGRGRGRGRNRRDDRGSDAANTETENGEAEQGPRDKLRATALWGLHTERKAKMVPFAGYEMPVQYKRGIMAEHRQTRDRAGLFDVSHMGQAFLTLEGEGGHEEIAALLEELVPANIRGLKSGGIKYTLLLNDEGGIIDDLMVTRPEGDAGNGMLFLVVNAGCKEKDFAHISAKLEGRAKLTIAGDRALIALQGPTASKNLSRFAPFVAEMAFMTAKACRIEGIECLVSRCGYTGEDGYEISLPNEHAETFARKLLTQRDIALVGLGARDSLRLESGLCLYGNDIDEETTPVEADLMWSIPKRRKENKDFPGADKIMKQFEDGTTRKRVGIKPEGKAPARDGTDIVDSEGKVVGKVTSGGFGPTVRGPIAMGYVETAQSEEGTEVGLMVRGQSRPARIVPLPFIPPRQFRPGQEVVEPTPELVDPVTTDEEVPVEPADQEDGAQEVAASEDTEMEDAVSEDSGQETTVAEESVAEDETASDDPAAEVVETEAVADGQDDTAEDDGETDDERT